MSIEAMKMALEALEDVQEAYGNHSEWFKQRVDALRAAIEQAKKQEPVAWMVVNGEGKIEETSHYKPSVERWLKYDETRRLVPLYTAPPQRSWQGLTDEDIYSIIESNVPPKLTTLFEIAAWVAKIVEAKLKEKNGG